jgi:hypothetical protein
VIREISEFERKYFGHRKRRETLDWESRKGFEEYIKYYLSMSTGVKKMFFFERQYRFIVQTMANHIELIITDLYYHSLVIDP